MAKKITNKLLQELIEVIGEYNYTYTGVYAEYQKDLNVLDFINKGLRIINFKNLPENIDKRVFIIQLFFRGRLVFFKHDTLGYFILPFTRTGGVNINGIQTHLHPVGVGDMANDINQMELEENVNCVIIRLNDLEIPPLLYAIYYGKKVTDTLDLIDNNNMWLKFPIIIKSTGDDNLDKKNALIIKECLDQKGMKFPVVTNALAGLEFFDVKPQYLGAELQEQKKAWKNDYYEYLGINHHEEKKERLTDNEVEHNEEENNINTMKIYGPLQDSIDKINKMFDLNIQIEINKDIMATETQNISQQISSKGVV